MTPLPFQIDDGGRAAAGFLGQTRDCVTRAIAIAMQRPYREVYDALNVIAGTSVARTGVVRSVTDEYMRETGWLWQPTMGIGTGCRVHLTPGELPKHGRLIVKVSRHMVAVVDGVARDTHNPCRGGKRCVYGYWKEGS